MLFVYPFVRSFGGSVGDSGWVPVGYLGGSAGDGAPEPVLFIGVVALEFLFLRPRPGQRISQRSGLVDVGGRVPPVEEPLVWLGYEAGVVWSPGVGSDGYSVDEECCFGAGGVSVGAE